MPEDKGKDLKGELIIDGRFEWRSKKRCCKCNKSRLFIQGN